MQSNKKKNDKKARDKKNPHNINNSKLTQEAPVQRVGYFIQRIKCSTVESRLTATSLLRPRFFLARRNGHTFYYKKPSLIRPTATF